MGVEPLRSPEEGWEPPEVLPGYRLVARIGRGGMGKVYLAREVQLDRLVAIKFLCAPAWVTSANDRFVAEARALARLDHPNVVRVFRIDEFEGHPFIAYEYVRGTNVERILKPVRWQTALTIATRVARALGAAHHAGLLHRDIKPGNVMISPTGGVKLLDFGLAIDTAAGNAPLLPRVAAAGGHAALAAGDRLTAPGLTVGTPRYWAPEQWHGQPATKATDVYGLGLLAYELVMGEPPYAGLAGEHLSHAVTVEDVPPIAPDLAPRPLLDVIAKCLERDPVERYQTGAEVAAALEEIESFFLHRSRSEAAVGSDEDVVFGSWLRVTSLRAALTDRVYALLFETRPELRRLFPADLAAQQDKLLHVLDLAIRSLHSPERIRPMLRELGARHVAYGVEPSMLDAFCRVLRRTLREKDPQWSDAIDAAWEHALRFIVASMRAGMDTASAPVSAPVVVDLTPSGPHAIDPPRTAYAQVGGSRVAYQVFGSGPPDLVLLPSLLSHVEATWTHPVPARLLAGLARFARVMILDRRGSGLSDPLDSEQPTADGMATDVAAVMSAAGSTRAIVVAASDAAIVGIRLAATRPDLVQALVLVGGAARFSAAPDYPEGRPLAFWDSLAERIRKHWDDATPVEILAPPPSRDASLTAWLASYFHGACSPDRAVENLRFVQEADERGSLASIEAPTLVIERTGDAWTTEAQARDLAAHIAGARLVALDDEDPSFFAGNVEGLVREIERFTAGFKGTELTAAHPGDSRA